MDESSVAFFENTSTQSGKTAASDKVYTECKPAQRYHAVDRWQEIPKTIRYRKPCRYLFQEHIQAAPIHKFV